MTTEPATEGPPATPSGPGSPRLKAALVLAAVFALGGFAGVAVGRVSALRELRQTMDAPPAEARTQFRLDAMRRRLDLSDDQLTRLRAIMSEADSERDTLMAKCGPGMDDLRKRTDERVREVLTEEQRKRFEEMEQRRGRHSGGRGPGHGPPPPP